ncbi:hypothetical protein [Natronospira sp.]|uniref:hypothetical protein n=1 Tax=Natronospira sp. TaxID=2024970 RepID=UPI003872E263
MTIHKTRGILYRVAKYLGDIQAISSANPEKVAKRVGRRMTGKVTGKAMRKLFK